MGTIKYPRTALRDSITMAREKPETPFVMSLIGGIFILVDGALGFMFSVRYERWPMWIWDFPGDEYVLGPIGILMGILIILSATLAYKQVKKISIWAAVIIVASLVSFFTILGGYVVGFVFGLIGGVLFLVWEPSEKKTCMRCGRIIRLDSIFCPYCGMSYAPGMFVYPGQYSAPQYQTQQQQTQTATAQPAQGPPTCATCGTKLFEGAVFCSNCGAKAR